MEFRQMRRFRQQLSKTECESVLAGVTAGTLALLGDNGYPYAVPLSHVYDDGKLYFHSALTGHKVDTIRNCDKASFCVIAADDVHPSELTTYFKSVIVFGRISIVDDDAERRYASSLLGERFNPGDSEGLQKEMDRFFANMLVFRLDIDHMTGKEAIELARNRAPAD